MRQHSFFRNVLAWLAAFLLTWAQLVPVYAQETGQASLEITCQGEGQITVTSNEEAITVRGQQIMTYEQGETVELSSSEVPSSVMINDQPVDSLPASLTLDQPVTTLIAIFANESETAAVDEDVENQNEILIEKPQDEDLKEPIDQDNQIEVIDHREIPDQKDEKQEKSGESDPEVLEQTDQSDENDPAKEEPRQDDKDDNDGQNKENDPQSPQKSGDADQQAPGSLSLYEPKQLTEQEQAMLKAQEQGDRTTYAKERAELVRAFGLEKYVDLDNFLTQAFFDRYDPRLLMLNELVLLYDFQKTYQPAQITLSSHDLSDGRLQVISPQGKPSENWPPFLPMPWGGNIAGKPFYLSNGKTAFCAYAQAAEPPVGDISTSAPYVVNNENLRKVIYYGYEGPDPYLTRKYGAMEAVALTSDLASYANKGTCIGTVLENGWHWKKGEQQVWNDLMAMPAPPANFEVYMVEFAGRVSEPSWAGLYTKQPLVYGEPTPQGSASVKKESAVSDLSTGCYSLAGAQYGLYASEADAKDDQNRLGTLTTDENGSSNVLSDLDVTTYYVKELQAPDNFEKDETIYPLEVTENQTAVLTVKDLPVLGALRIYKKDDHNKPLEGVQFEVINRSKNTIWFDANSDGKADQDELISDGKTVTVVSTNTKGIAAVSGLSYGTYEIREAKGIPGYLSDPDWSETVTIDSPKEVVIEMTNKQAAISTTASAQNGTHQQQVGKKITIRDVVSYQNLDTTQSYTIKGVLMDAKTGKPVLDAAGREVSAKSQAFKPEKPDGTITLEFTLDASDLAGAKTVVFETLYQDGKEIASHKDLEDEGQSIQFFDFHTQAAGENGSHVQIIGSQIVLIDTVSYTGLKPGQEYQLIGTLMNKESGKPLLDEQDQPITAKTLFTPEKEEGTVEVTFKFNGEHLKDLDLVVFEKLLMADTEIGDHEDLEDEDQTVELRSYVLKIQKTDQNDKPIKDKEFVFTSYRDPSCKDKIAEHKPDENGLVIFENIQAGKPFYIKETRAPEGYELSKQVIKVEAKQDGLYVDDQKVDAEDYVFEMTFANNKLPEPSKPAKPENTGLKTDAAITIGAGLAALGALLFFEKKHSEK